MISQGHAIWAKPIKASYQPAKFGGHRQYGNEDIMVLVCHVILQDYMMKESCDSMGRSPSGEIAVSPSWWHRHCGS